MWFVYDCSLWEVLWEHRVPRLPWQYFQSQYTLSESGVFILVIKSSLYNGCCMGDSNKGCILSPLLFMIVKDRNLWHFHGPWYALPEMGVSLLFPDDVIILVSLYCDRFTLKRVWWGCHQHLQVCGYSPLLGKDGLSPSSEGGETGLGGGVHKWRRNGLGGDSNTDLGGRMLCPVDLDWATGTDNIGSRGKLITTNGTFIQSIMQTGHYIVW